MRLDWSLPRIHSTKLTDCKYENTYFRLLVDAQKFCSKIKVLEIFGQIVTYNQQNQINVSKKCFHVENGVCSNLLKMYKVFCLKELSGAIIQASTVRVAVLLEAIVWVGAIIWVAIILGEIFLGGNCSGSKFLGRQFSGALEPKRFNVYFNLKKQN